MADRKDVRLTVFVTPKMDDQLDEIATLQGLSKHELIRTALANYIGGWNQSVQLARQLVDEKLLKMQSEKSKKNEPLV